MMAADLPPAPPAEIRLAPCPDTPNCVSSLAPDRAHRVEPLPLAGAPEEALERLREIIEGMPRAVVDEAGGGRLKARFRSLVFGWVDDVELVAGPRAGVIHIRSASRGGRSDLGVNRRRVGKIRSRYSP